MDCIRRLLELLGLSEVSVRPKDVKHTSVAFAVFQLLAYLYVQLNSFSLILLQKPKLQCEDQFKLKLHLYENPSYGGNEMV